MRVVRAGPHHYIAGISRFALPKLLMQDGGDTVIEYCNAMLLVYKHEAVYVDEHGTETTIPEPLMAIAVRKAYRVGGIMVRDMRA